MKYDEAGTYELTYEAVDECGNVSTQARTIVVEEPQEQYITLIDLSSYTAPNNTPMPKANEWDMEKSGNLIVEASGVVANGTTPLTVVEVGWDGELTKPWIYVAFDYVEGVIESGCGVWFESEDYGSTKFISHIGSIGPGELVPSTITFEKLVVKQEVE